MDKKEKKKLKMLFEKLKTRRKEAIEELYNNYNKTVYGIAFSILKNKEDSEDVVQIVFSKLYVLDKEKLPKEKEATWLYSVTKNESLAILKKKYDNIDLEDIYNLEDYDNEIDKSIDKNSYNKLIDKLDKKEQEIVSLKVLANLTFSEIAEILGESTSTIKWRYYKAVYTLKLLLSNLSMFIITVTLGILGVKNQNKSADYLEDEVQITNDIMGENLEENGDKEIAKDEENNENVIEEDETTDSFENTIVQEETIQYNTNYFSIGMISISAVF